ncbi:MAG TPA: hypothetical protein VK550_19195 [Polyangiaceae bacterium]|nr:hypothetical protein [Polyangiaceae bacterium]
MAALRWIDTSHPRKWICILPANFTFDEFTQEFTNAIEELRRLPNTRRVIVLTDMDQMTHSEARRRQRSAQFIKEHKEVFRRHIIAWGFVTTKGVIRGALTAIAWLRAFPVPMNVFSTRRECEAWLEERLAADSASSMSRGRGA